MRQSIDGFNPIPRQPLLDDRTATRPHLVTPRPPSPRPTPARTYAKPVLKPRRQLPAWLQLVLISIGTLLIGNLAQSAVLGQLAVVIYGIIAVIWRIPSRTTFLLAVLSLLATTWMLVMQGKVALSQNFATYTFWFLVVGVITLSRELKKEGGRIYSSRKTNNPP